MVMSTWIRCNNSQLREMLYYPGTAFYVGTVFMLLIEVVLQWEKYFNFRKQS